MICFLFGVGLVVVPLYVTSAFLFGKTDIETTSRDEREWQRKQTEKGYLEKGRSIGDAEIEHIRDCLRQP